MDKKDQRIVDTTVAAIHDEQLWQDTQDAMTEQIGDRWQDRVVDQIVANTREKTIRNAERYARGVKHTAKSHENRLGHSKKAGSPRNPFYREHNVEYAATADNVKIPYWEGHNFTQHVFRTCLLDLGSPPLRDDNGPASIEARVEWCERLYDWWEKHGNGDAFVAFSKAYDQWWYRQTKLHSV